MKVLLKVRANFKSRSKVGAATPSHHRRCYHIIVVGAGAVEPPSLSIMYYRLVFGRRFEICAGARQGRDKYSVMEVESSFFSRTESIDKINSWGFYLWIVWAVVGCCRCRSCGDGVVALVSLYHDHMRRCAMIAALFGCIIIYSLMFHPYPPFFFLCTISCALGRKINNWLYQLNLMFSKKKKKKQAAGSTEQQQRQQIADRWTYSAAVGTYSVCRNDDVFTVHCHCCTLIPGI